MESSRFNSTIKEIIRNYKEIYVDIPPRINMFSTDHITNINRITNNGNNSSDNNDNNNDNMMMIMIKRMISNIKLSLLLMNWLFYNYQKLINNNDKNYYNNNCYYQVKPLSRLIQDLRLVKSDSEIKLMKKAGEITGKAFIEVKY